MKKSLLGLPFDPKEQSTDGIAVDPSKCEVEVDQIKTWQSTSEKSTVLSDVCRDVSRLLAEERYLEILSVVKQDSSMKESKMESVGSADAGFPMMKVCTLQLAPFFHTTDMFLYYLCYNKRKIVGTVSFQEVSFFLNHTSLTKFTFNN